MGTYQAHRPTRWPFLPHSPLPPLSLSRILPVHPTSPPLPDFSAEQAHWALGRRYVAGLDEAGRGCLAGPVVAAAVVLPPDARLPGLDDSKVLAPAVRERLYGLILAEALAVGVGTCSPEEIDRLNILWASMEAMRRAFVALALPAEAALVDGNRVPPGLPCLAEPLIRGDGRSLSIAAASVVAKVTRDRLMTALDVAWPPYGFAVHKGYPTAAHYAALATHGPTPLHRRTFRLSR